MHPGLGLEGCNCQWGNWAGDSLSLVRGELQESKLCMAVTRYIGTKVLQKSVMTGV